jgi:hypothetical protein
MLHAEVFVRPVAMIALTSEEPHRQGPGGTATIITPSGRTELTVTIYSLEVAILLCRPEDGNAGRLCSCWNRSPGRLQSPGRAEDGGVK